MQQLLVIGHFTDEQISRVVAALREQPQIQLSGYGSKLEQQRWPKNLPWTQGPLRDGQRLRTALRHQTTVFMQLDSKQLVPQTQLITTLSQIQGGPRLILKSSESILTLGGQATNWIHQLASRRQLRAIRSAEMILQQSSLDFVWIQGTTAADTTKYSRTLAVNWVTAVPTRRVLDFGDFLSFLPAGPFAA